MEVVTTEDADTAGFDTLPERLRDKITIDPSTGCWVWVGARSSKGYGLVKHARRVVAAHRVVYEHVRGPVPVELECDHLCRNRACVNPRHLEPVTHRENSQRSDGSWKGGDLQRSKTHCPQGHAYTAENIYVNPTTQARSCRTCGRVAQRAYTERRRAAA